MADLSTEQGNRVLLLKPRLYNKLGVQGLLDPGLFELIAVTKERYYLFVAERGQIISNIQTGPFLKGPANALSFAAAIKGTRKIAPDVPLHDAIYIQELSRLLPTFPEEKPFDDQTVLGTWLTGGVRISTEIEIVRHAPLAVLKKQIKHHQGLPEVVLRLVFVQLRYTGMSVVQAAEAVGVSGQTGYNWQVHWNTEGLPGLVPKYAGALS